MGTGQSGRQMFLWLPETQQPGTKLPFLVKLPLEGGLGLKTREAWPRTSRLYCHPFEEEWPEDPDILERVPVLFCRRRGAAIDLVLDRPRMARSQFVFTEVRGPGHPLADPEDGPDGQLRRTGPPPPCARLRLRDRGRLSGALRLPVRRSGRAD